MSDRFSKSKELLIKNSQNKDNEIAVDDAVEKDVEEGSEAEAEKTLQMPKKRKSKGIEYNPSMPLVLKNLRIPVELELAIKELKARRNAARPVTREKLVTEEAIILEALEHYFLEPGLNTETIDYVLNDKMKYLVSVGRNS